MLDPIWAYLAVFRLFTDLITNSNRLQTQIVTPVYNFGDNTCSGVIHIPSNMDIGSEDIDRQLNKVKLFPCLSVHIHA